jgi:DNA modification methylase
LNDPGQRERQEDVVPEPRTVELAGAPPTSAVSAESEPWRNRLIHGEARDTLAALLPELAGRVGLVYVDPPFSTGGAFAITRAVPGGSVTIPAYADVWEGGLAGYLAWFREVAGLVRELLDPRGALLVHCDWRAGAHLRLLLDDVFGAENFRNEIVWAYRSGGASRTESLPRKHDTILLYARSPRFQVRAQTERQYLRKPFMGSHQDDAGRYYVDTLLRDVLEGEITLVRQGALQRYNVRPVLNVSAERLDYPTQKPLGLLKLLLEVASSPGDLVLDPCCGSGTLAIAAETTGRRWIASDTSLPAIQTARKRLLALPAPSPFAVATLAPEAHDEEGDLTLAAEVQPTLDGACVTVRIAGYAPASNRLPTLAATDNADPAAWLDVWAVDWDFDGAVFRVGSHAARDRRGAPPPLALAHSYERRGPYSIALRVTDLLGGETTRALRVEAATASPS